MNPQLLKGLILEVPRETMGLSLTFCLFLSFLRKSSRQILGQPNGTTSDIRKVRRSAFA